jgi:hypothetical protein
MVFSTINATERVRTIVGDGETIHSRSAPVA